jgi:hypothetical protein
MTHQVADSRLFRRSQVAVKIMPARVAEHINHQPSPMAKATAVASPITGSMARNMTWLTACREEPSLSLVAQALTSPRSCTAANSHSTTEESNPFMASRILSVSRLFYAKAAQPRILISAKAISGQAEPPFGADHTPFFLPAAMSVLRSSTAFSSWASRPL